MMEDAKDVRPVVVHAYTEALCIDCKRYFQSQLYKTFHALGPQVIDLKFVPYGNSRLDEASQTVQCQHGEAECDANIWEQCAIEQSPPTVYMEFLNCLEGKLPMGYSETPFQESLFLDCAAETSELDGNALKKCHDNPMLRWQLQEKYAKATPEHEYVPWIVVDGEKINEEKDDLLEFVCKAYTAKGGIAPSCNSFEWN